MLSIHAVAVGRKRHARRRTRALAVELCRPHYRRPPSRSFRCSVIIASDLSHDAHYGCRTPWQSTGGPIGTTPRSSQITERNRLRNARLRSQSTSLVRRGWLLRKARGGDTAGANGFEYILCIPQKPEKRVEGRSAQVLNAGQHQNGQVLMDVQHSTTVLNVVQHGVEPDTEGAERGSETC